MSFQSSRLVALVPIVGIMSALAGCARAPKEIVAAPPPPVIVSVPVEKSVNDYVELTGQTAAVESVEVRPRVWGYLVKVNFKEGTLVKEGDVLYEIDARTYKAAFDEATAKVALDDANLRFSEADFQRISEAASKGAVSKQEMDKTTAARDAAAAALRADTAALELRKLDFEYTKVKAPISGRVSRTQVTVGNLVQGGQTGSTLLTNIVSVSPIYAYFDVDEGTVLRVRRMIREGTAKSARDVELPVLLGLANEQGQPHRGIIDFVDNQVNPKTGTLRVRAVFANEDGVLHPGYFVRVRVPVGLPHKALLITERAIDSDQGQKIVYVVNEKNEVVSRPIRVGALHDGLRVVEAGLSPGERLIVSGIQQVRPGITVEPKLQNMPASLSESEFSGSK